MAFHRCLVASPTCQRRVQYPAWPSAHCSATPAPATCRALLRAVPSIERPRQAPTVAASSPGRATSDVGHASQGAFPR
eukprot:10952101-Alexandrium_andersonii.AAC.1